MNFTQYSKTHSRAMKRQPCQGLQIKHMQIIQLPPFSIFTPKQDQYRACPDNSVTSASNLPCMRCGWDCLALNYHTPLNYHQVTNSKLLRQTISYRDNVVITYWFNKRMPCPFSIFTSKIAPVIVASMVSWCFHGFFTIINYIQVRSNLAF